MMEYLFDTVLLSRLQFAFTISFHIIFPAFTIGLASWLVVLEAFWLKTKSPVYKETYQLWVKIFAITFGMGVVSGLVLSYEFGTNWSEFSARVGNVMGPLLGFEVMTAFFLEASFLGIMLFGWNRVSPKIHFISTFIVAIGTLLSAFWILSANSWMQTPDGFIVNGNEEFLPTNWLTVIFNPSFHFRFFHMVIAAYLTSAFVISGVGAWYLLKQKHLNHAKVIYTMALFIIVVFAPIQLFVGDAHGLNTLKYQPVKIAAMEGIWNNEKGAALRLFGIPDEKTEQTKYAIEVPYLASIILTRSVEGEVKGLKNWPRNDRPPVAIVFFSFRLMVGIGILMIVTGITALVLFLRKRLFHTRWFHKVCLWLSPLGFIAILSGWFVSEVGRQPYVVYNFLRTKEMVSPVSGMAVFFTLVTFIIVYLFVFGAGIYYMIKLIKKGPATKAIEDTYGQHGIDRPPTLAEIFQLKSKRNGNYSDGKYSV